MFLRRLAGLVAVTAALSLSGCQPGLGRQVSAHDFAFAFTQRDDITIRTLSTARLRNAVWDRLDGAAEFRKVAAILGHGRQVEVVDSQFRDREAVIQVRTDDRVQYRLYLLYEEDDWRVDDVLKETSTGVFESMGRQAEAVLAVRDFGRALESGDRKALVAASSPALAQELSSSSASSIQDVIDKVRTGMVGEVGRLFEPRHEALAARVGDPQYTVYFVVEGGKLVVDDIAIPGSGSSLRKLLGGGAGRAATTPR